MIDRLLRIALVIICIVPLLLLLIGLAIVVCIVDKDGLFDGPEIDGRWTGYGRKTIIPK